MRSGCRAGGSVYRGLTVHATKAGLVTGVSRDCSRLAEGQGVDVMSRVGYGCDERGKAWARGVLVGLDGLDCIVAARVITFFVSFSL